MSGSATGTGKAVDSGRAGQGASGRRAAGRRGTAATRLSRLSPRTRKALLTCHVIAAVGWLGVELAQVILAVAGFLTESPELLRATRLVMELLGVELIALLAWTSLLTGLVLALATPWGLLRHYWIAAKLVVNVALMLAGHFLFRHWLQQQVAAPSEGVGVQLAAGAGAGLALLAAATAISVHKPWGRTRFVLPWARSVRRVKNTTHSVGF
ncbi:hypothetical protein [Streptomyces sp. KR80]|uniref:hypothetical protein n=1 Tax=Streptomyces sp. KR80 TaxID=3457426 RepID=UPI003FD67F99